MHEDTATLVISVITVVILYTTSLIAVVLWLAGKFRSLEKLIYREIHEHRDEDNVRFREHGDRLLWIEVNLGKPSHSGFMHDPLK